MLLVLYHVTKTELRPAFIDERSEYYLLQCVLLGPQSCLHGSLTMFLHGVYYVLMWTICACRHVQSARCAGNAPRASQFRSSPKFLSYVSFVILILIGGTSEQLLLYVCVFNHLVWNT